MSFYLSPFSQFPALPCIALPCGKAKMTDGVEEGIQVSIGFFVWNFRIAKDRIGLTNAKNLGGNIFRPFAHISKVHSSPHAWSITCERLQVAEFEYLFVYIFVII